MSYPKQPPFMKKKPFSTPVAYGKRDQLRTLLLNKFKLKYSNFSSSNLDLMIAGEVEHFMKEGSMTEAKLRGLDARISKQAQDIKCKEQEEGTYQEIKPMRGGNMNLGLGIQNSTSNKKREARSLTPYRQGKMTRAERYKGLLEDYKVHNPREKSVGKIHHNQTHKPLGTNQSAILTLAQEDKGIEGNDYLDIQTPPKDRLHSKSYIEMSRSPGLPPIQVQNTSAEEDLWSRIIQYNKVKHIQEQMKNAMNDKEGKRQIKEELDKQIAEKHMFRLKEREVHAKYEKMVFEKNMKLEDDEKKKQVQMKYKVLQEKKLRDSQLREEQVRKQKVFDDGMKIEKEEAKKVQQLLDEEVQGAKTRKEQQVATMRKMIEENEKYKQIQIDSKLKEKEKDVKLMEEYTKYQEVQEAKRTAQLKAKEDRIQAFMNIAAENVVKEQKNKLKQEDEQILKSLIIKEKREKAEEDKKKYKKRLLEVETNKFLEVQISEKKEYMRKERDINEEYAGRWKKDSEVYQREMKKKADDKKKVNKAHAEDIKKQITDKRTLREGMNNREFMFNKNLLNEVDQTLKDNPHLVQASPYSKVMGNSPE